MSTDWRNLESEPLDSEDLVVESSEFGDLLKARIEKNKKKRFYEDKSPLTTSRSETTIAKLVEKGPISSTTEELLENFPEEVPNSANHRLFVPLEGEALDRVRSQRHRHLLALQAAAEDKIGFEKFVRIFKADGRREIKEAFVEKWHRDAFAPQLAVVFVFIFYINFAQLSHKVTHNESTEVASNQAAPAAAGASPGPAAAPSAGAASINSQAPSAVAHAHRQALTNPIVIEEDEARRLQTLVDQYPQEQGTRRRLAELLMKLDRTDEAVIQWEELRRLGAVSEDDLLSLAAAFAAAGKYQQAWDLYADILAKADRQETRIKVYDQWITGLMSAGMKTEAMKLAGKAAAEAKSTAEREHFTVLRQATARVAEAALPRPTRKMSGLAAEPSSFGG